VLRFGLCFWGWGSCVGSVLCFWSWRVPLDLYYSCSFKKLIIKSEVNDKREINQEERESPLLQRPRIG
jgi:hypothetical protein